MENSFLLSTNMLLNKKWTGIRWVDLPGENCSIWKGKNWRLCWESRDCSSVPLSVGYENTTVVFTYSQFTSTGWSFTTIQKWWELKGISSPWDKKHSHGIYLITISWKFHSSSHVLAVRKSPNDFRLEIKDVLSPPKNGCASKHTCRAC